MASELSVEDGLLLRGNRIVILMALRAPVLNRLHEGHLGINKMQGSCKGISVVTWSEQGIGSKD